MAEATPHAGSSRAPGSATGDPHGARQRDWIWLVAVLAVAGAAVRLATLDVQSIWLDEAVTHRLLVRSLGGMLGAIPHSESTPPLYYVLEWAWVHVFGTGAVGMRSLSALAGSVTIVLLALIARRLCGPRAAVAAAALAASNPLLIWYSQEARAYALLVTLCALSLWLLLREDWAAFALAAAAALATHYFALFVIAPELAWIAWRHARRSRAAAFALAAVLVVGAALAPLAIEQAGGSRAAFITASPIATRLEQVPKQFLIGYSTPHQAPLTVLALLLALGLATGLRRSDRGLLALAVLALGVPLALVAAGADYLITRNLIVALVPLIVLAAIAATRPRVGPWLIGGLCALGIVAFVGVETNAAYQRDDWRAVASALAPARAPRALVVDPASGVPALSFYVTHLAPVANGAAVSAQEIDVVELARHPTAAPAAPPAGFASCAPPTRTAEFELVRYCAATPLSVPYFVLVGLALHTTRPAILSGG